jgi:alpha-L-fucosidase 2
MAVRLTASKPGALSCIVKLKGAHGEKTAAAVPKLTTPSTFNTIFPMSFVGRLPNGLAYETSLVAGHDGGSVREAGGNLEFDGCEGVTLYIAAGTNYVMDYQRHYRGDDPHTAIQRRLTSASSNSYAANKDAHIADYQCRSAPRRDKSRSANRRTLSG